MSTEYSYFSEKDNLILKDLSKSSITIESSILALSKLENEFTGCRLSFRVSPQLYQRIDTNVLFNLKPEVRVPISTKPFFPKADIEIEVHLKFEFLLHLAKHGKTADEVKEYFLYLNQKEPDSPFLFTENWLGLSVKQQQKSGEAGYTTLWAYFNPANFTQASNSGEAISTAVSKFFKDWTKSNLSAVNEAAIPGINGLTDLFQELSDIGLNSLEKETKKTFTEAESESSDPPIFESIISFFTKDDWPFQKLKSEPTLRLSFQGKSGIWDCYARAREERQQFIFYSICPINAPENKRLALAEFITLANCGMIIGNFELDFADGEIRFKTSIDVQGDFLSFELIKQLVYANVTMMDEYLPGIKSVIESDVLPEDAIHSIEQAET